MQTTPNFGFNIAEGTDTVNLLTQLYPNFTNLDSILQAIKETGVTTATATKTGTNFAVVRTDTDCNFFRFIATANYAAGDTFTVDGVAVTATSAAGTALPGGAFVINQSVIAVLNSSVLTVLVGGGLSSVDAEDVDYDNSVSGLTATDVQTAIDEVLGDIPTGFAATAITYDNTGSGLVATNVQAAIDELQTEIGSLTPQYSTAGLVAGAHVSDMTGGYYVDNTGMAHVDITFVLSSSKSVGTVLISGFPPAQTAGAGTYAFIGSPMNKTSLAFAAGDTTTTLKAYNSTTPADTYRFIGSYQSNVTP